MSKFKIKLNEEYEDYLLKKGDNSFSCDTRENATLFENKKECLDFVGKVNLKFIWPNYRILQILGS